MSDSDDEKSQGFTQIPNELLEKAILLGLTKREYQVFLVIARKTYGWQKDSDRISLSQFSELTGLKINKVSTTLSSLISKKVVIRKDRKYSINKQIEDWFVGKTSPKTVQVPKHCQSQNGTSFSPKTGLEQSQNGTKTSPKTVTTKEKKETKQNKLLNKREEIQELIPFDDKTQIKKPKSSELEVSAQGIFDFWIEAMNKTGRTIFSAKRKKAVMKRLKEYPVDEIKLAIINCAASDWHMGRENPDKVNNDLELICRDSEHLERFRDKVNPRANSDTFNPAPDEQDDDEFIQVGFFRVRKTPEQKLNNDCIEGEVIQ